VNSRVFVFHLPAITAASPFRVDLHAYFPLPPGDAEPDALDPEGIAITRTGRLFISSEGLGDRSPRVPPSVIEYTRNYEFVRQLGIPEKFIPPVTGAAQRGVRGNAAFESLTVAPDDASLYTATESALAQDGPDATTAHGATVRILEFREGSGTYSPAREFAYDIDALPEPGFRTRVAVTGLVELIALGGGEFLTLERGYQEEVRPGPGRRNTIRIFRMSIRGATDISGMDSLDGRRDVVRARKTLLLDLADLAGLSSELATLENFEGMTLGPRVPDGSRTLLIVSDDNFNRAQRTSFLLFRIR
jgi:hypothetical protein